ncbi:MAG: hypothetical protein IT449_10390 [Phycisphaerales bacterium]|nr:hypothetical protein [Phycisphaerales bacterium]
MRVGCGLIILPLLPLLMGGCPEQMQNATADAFETATRSILDSALTLAFDQIRTDTGNR